MDALLEASKHHWVFKKNKSISQSNARFLRQGRTDKVKPKKKYSDAPNNLVQRNNFLPEAVVFYRFRDHMIVNVASDGISTTTAEASLTRVNMEDFEDAQEEAQEEAAGEENTEENSTENSTAIAHAKVSPSASESTSTSQRNKRSPSMSASSLSADLTALDSSDDEEAKNLRPILKKPQAQGAMTSRYRQRKNERELKSQTIKKATKAAQDKAIAQKLSARASLATAQELMSSGKRGQWDYLT